MFVAVIVPTPVISNGLVWASSGVSKLYLELIFSLTLIHKYTEFRGFVELIFVFLLKFYGFLLNFIGGFIIPILGFRKFFSMYIQGTLFFIKSLKHKFLFIGFYKLSIYYLLFLRKSFYSYNKNLLIFNLITTSNMRRSLIINNLYFRGYLGNLSSISFRYKNYLRKENFLFIPLRILAVYPYKHRKVKLVESWVNGYWISFSNKKFPDEWGFHYEI